VRKIRFGKFDKQHVCNVKDFEVRVCIPLSSPTLISRCWLLLLLMCVCVCVCATVLNTRLETLLSPAIISRTGRDACASVLPQAHLALLEPPTVPAALPLDIRHNSSWPASAVRLGHT
jgi:hypothetical protein